MEIRLKSNGYIVKNIRRKTNALGWKDLRVGDIIIIYLTPLQNGNASGGNSYQTYFDIDVRNGYTTRYSFRCSQSKLVWYMKDFFEFEELEYIGE